MSFGQVHGTRLAVLFLVLGIASRAFPQRPSVNGANNDIQEAKHLIYQGRFDAALSVLDKLAHETPEPAGIETLLGEIDYEKRQYILAIEHLRLSLKQNPDDTEAFQLLGLCYYLMDESEKALPVLQEILQKIPDPSPLDLDILADAYLRANQYDQARETFARMFHVDPQSAQAYLIVAQMIMRGLDRATAAIPELQRAIALDPRLPMAHFLLGVSYLYESRLHLAIKEFKQEILIDPVQRLAYWRLGDAYSRLGNWLQAEQSLEEAIWIDPNFTGPYILLGKVELSKGDPYLAVGFLQHAIKMDPDDSSAHYLLGRAYQQLGRASEADHEFALAQSLHTGKDTQ